MRPTALTSSLMTYVLPTVAELDKKEWAESLWMIAQLPEDVEEVEVCADQTCGTKESVGVIESVFTRGLVAQKPSVQSILKVRASPGALWTTRF